MRKKCLHTNLTATTSGGPIYCVDCRERIVRSNLEYKQKELEKLERSGSIKPVLPDIGDLIPVLTMYDKDIDLVVDKLNQVIDYINTNKE